MAGLALEALLLEAHHEVGIDKSSSAGNEGVLLITWGSFYVTQISQIIFYVYYRVIIR